MPSNPFFECLCLFFRSFSGQECLHPSPSTFFFLFFFPPLQCIRHRVGPFSFLEGETLAPPLSAAVPITQSMQGRRREKEASGQYTKVSCADDRASAAKMALLVSRDLCMKKYINMFMRCLQQDRPLFPPLFFPYQHSQLFFFFLVFSSFPHGPSQCVPVPQQAPVRDLAEGINK